jgi:CRP/FNR family transcriptional regulator, cyclic AMP receptor protein
MESGTAETATILPRLPQSLAVQLFAGATPHHLKAGEALFMVGGSGDGCYRLEQGLLKVVVTSPRGDNRILAVLGPGSIAGELALIDGRPRSASVFAIRDCELRFVGRNAFEECMAQHPEIYRYLVNVLAARLRETNEVVAAANFLTVEARLARALLDLAQHFRGHSEAEQIVISHKMTQNDLAAMAGVARENVSRVLTDWKERKIVVRSSGYYCLCDVAALKRKGSA